MAGKSDKPEEIVLKLRPVTMGRVSMCWGPLVALDGEAAVIQLNTDTTSALLIIQVT